jgi:uncharacterized protein YecA (UPF0149 family)
MGSRHHDGGLVERLPLHDARDGFIFDLDECEYVLAEARWMKVVWIGKESRVESSEEQRDV